MNLKLLIDEAAQASLSHLAIRFGSSKSVVNVSGLQLTIPVGIFDVSFYQMDKNEKYLSCSMDFEDECSFGFEVVRIAIGGESNSHIKACIAPIGSEESLVREFNSAYVKNTVDFLENNSWIFLEFPPSWFLAACEVEKRKLSKKFPEIASSEFKRKSELWSRWKNRSDNKPA